MTSWRVLSTISGAEDSNLSASARASITLEGVLDGKEKTSVLKGNLDLLVLEEDTNGKEFLLRCLCVIKDDVNHNPPLSWDVPLPEGKWRVSQAAVRHSRNGNHSALTFNIQFHGPLQRIKFLLPIIDGNDTQQQLFFSGVQYANMMHGVQS
ncbi:hypothetical protein SEMRO_239_G095800.1 [Seminavis robusta]|uniref:Uncharacterized protein n=1 Tax=Seminavis robusta TaxID=568900 RepID=A0A9N8DP41_9STRA|nr:hypothetical protein SEMRO_239_G095800.1 [Seminavis robusta]|eukprot:Sro239_g095800.1 n/a (152) ;mRNA; r:23310-23765